MYILFLILLSTEVLAWLANDTNTDCFVFQRSIQIFNPHMNLTNIDVLLEINTQEMISAGHLRSNCRDIRFIYGDIVLSHYLEGKCNEVNTQIWITMPRLTVNVSYSLDMYYYCPTPPFSSEEVYDGRWTIFSKGTCSGRWANDTDSRGHLAAAGTSYTVVEEDNIDHNHNLIGASGTESNEVDMDSTSSGYRSSDNGHLHIFITETNEKSAMPRYKTLPFCWSPTLEKFPVDSVLTFSDLSGLPNVTLFTEMNNFFIYSGESFDNTVHGANQHRHHYDDYSMEMSGGSVRVDNDYQNAWVTIYTHVHRIEGDTAYSSNIPPYHTARLGVLGIEYPQLPTNYIALTNGRPPKGWVMVQVVQGKFLRGANSFQDGGVTDYDPIHVHGPFTVTLQNSNSDKRNCEQSDENHVATGGHTHSVSVTTTDEEIILPRIDYVVVRRLYVQCPFNVTYSTDVRLRPDYNIAETEWTPPTSETTSGGGETDDGENETESGGSGGGNPAAVAVAIIITLVVICVIVLVIVLAVVGIVLYAYIARRRRTKHLSAMINAVVDTAEKENELHEKEAELEEEKAKLEKEKNMEKEEKDNLKNQLNMLKQEQMKLSFSKKFFIVESNVPLLKDKDIRLQNKEMYTEIDGRVHVFGATWNNQKCILKRLSSKEVNNSLFKIEEWLQREVGFLHDISHPNITKVIAMTKKPILGMLIEKMEINDTEKFLRERAMNFNEKVRILYEISIAGSYMHKNHQKIHGNLSWKRITLTKEMKPKLDFGFTSVLVPNYKRSKYAAPELITNVSVDKDEDDEDDEEDEDDEDENQFEESNLAKQDTFAFGIMMFEILCNDFHFGLGRLPNNVGEKIANSSEYRPKLTDRDMSRFPNWYVNLMRQCYMHDAYTRPSFERIRNVVNAVIEI